MGVHIYTNGVWTDSGRIYRNSLNLFNKSTALIDYYVNDTNGIISKNTTYNTSASASIDVEGLEYIYPNTNEYTSARAWGAFYDDSNNYVSGFNGYNFAIAVPSNAKTVRFTVSNIYIDAFSVNGGSLPIPYEPYNVVDWYANIGHGYSSGAWS